MKKNRRTVFCIVLCTAMLTGCGGEYAGLTEGNAVSGSVVSGGAVSEGAVNDKVAEPDAASGSAVENAKQDMSSYRFCTDTNVYYADLCGQIEQMRIDGTHRKCILERCEYTTEVVYADEDWLYYGMIGYDDEITYRAPIGKDAKGYDVVDFSKEEKLVSSYGDDPHALYADSDYYFYEDQLEEKMIKYDLKRKEKVSESEIVAEFFLPLGDYYIMASHGGIYSQKKDSVQWTKVSEYVEGTITWLWDINPIQGDGEEIFYPQQVTEKEDEFHFKIKRYDGQREWDFATGEELSHVARGAIGGKRLDICEPYEMFLQDDRLYIQFLIGWMEKGIYHVEYMICSKEKTEEDSGLRYEKELTECMKSHVKEQRGKYLTYEKEYDQQIVVNSAQCMAMVDRTAYLNLYDYEKDKERLGCYDLSTGKFQWITDEDAVFYKPYYDCSWWEWIDDQLDRFFIDCFNEFVPTWVYENESGFVMEGEY
ncbi:MAG: hypothetical protein NC293_01565 [Roseburia sp.]|nr:hypothetical protein [Roseburia sp.]